MNNIKVLIVDDNYEKIGVIANQVAGFEHIKIETKNNVREALNYLRSNQCDILVVDMILPKVLGEEPNENAGIELINMLYNSTNLNIPIAIIAVTSHSEAYTTHKHKLAEIGVPFVIIESPGDMLKSIINHKIKYCEKFKSMSKLHLVNEQDENLQDTDDVTLKWLFNNVKLSQWIAFAGILISAFTIGIQFGQTDFYKGITNNQTSEHSGIKGSEIKGSE